MTTTLDWSGRGHHTPLARVGPLMPCQHCGQPALLRHPATDKPCHKTCAERDINRRAASHATARQE